MFYLWSCWVDVCIIFSFRVAVVGIFCWLALQANLYWFSCDLWASTFWCFHNWLVTVLVALDFIIFWLDQLKIEDWLMFGVLTAKTFCGRLRRRYNQQKILSKSFLWDQRTSLEKVKLRSLIAVARRNIHSLNNS